MNEDSERILERTLELTLELTLERITGVKCEKEPGPLSILDRVAHDMDELVIPGGDFRKITLA